MNVHRSASVSRAALALVCLLAAEAGHAEGPDSTAVTLYRFNDGRVMPAEGADVEAPVGSLQKAWVARAWASAHADTGRELPRVRCDSSSRCWLHTGHGELGLRAATALSCNAYFRALAEDTPEEIRRTAFRDAGFSVAGPLSVDASIGLEARAPSVTISPRRLLQAYADLIAAPWIVREDVRKEWLEGMRDAAEDGTALDLPFRGLLAKTGTVPASGKPAWGVAGWALVFDPGGKSGWLAFLPHGTGSQAAAAFGKRIAPELSSLARKPPRTRASRARTIATRTARPRAVDEPIRIELFEALRTRPLHVRNLGSAPVRRERNGVFDWVGTAAAVELERGDRLSEGFFELSLPRYRLVRRVRGALDASGGHVVLVASRRAYVEGVIRGELRRASPERAEELGSAVLRFAALRPRHGNDAVCDLSHCARFVGEGPDVEWISPVRARMSVAPPQDQNREEPYLDDAAWGRVLVAASSPGPSLWSAHCGGEPLSSYSVWGSGVRGTASCPRHGEGGSGSSGGSTNTAPWSRFLPQSVLDKAFGAGARLEAREREGVRTTVVTVAGSERFMLYDEIHRGLSSPLGWDALPSPPDGYTEAAGGWQATGRGFGHRVGICLAD
ncbi:MAG: hypothetical protein ABIT01_05800 [Thermoanaerobaculia bacterium]